MSQATPNAIPPVTICPACGAVALPGRDRCQVCKAGLVPGAPLAVPSRDDGRFWLMVRARFQCRHCGHLSPLNHLDVDGTFECLRCSFEQAADPDVWREALRFCHDVGDLAGSPEGRQAAEHSVAGNNKYADVGVKRAAGQFQVAEMVMEGGMIKTKNLQLLAGPGAPTCAKCQRPLDVEVTRRGALASRCGGCGETATYEVDDKAMRMHKPLVGAIADEHRVDRPSAKLNAPSPDGAVSIQCPNCGGALPIEAKDHFVTCRFCSTASRVPVRMRSQLFKDGVEQDRWWVLVEGKSPLREKLLSKARKHQAHVARQSEQARLAAERRAQQPRLPGAAPAPAAAKPAAARKNPLAFLSIGIAVAAAGSWFVTSASPTKVEQAQVQPQAGKTEKGGDVKRPKAKKKKTEKEKPIPAAAFPLMTGCACKIPDPKTGKTTGVQLGMLTSHNGTMSMGSVVRKMFGARYMLRGQGWDVPLEPGPEDATPPSIEGIRVDFAVGCSSDVVAIVGTRAVTGYSVETKKRIWSSLLPERFGPERLVEGDLAVHCHEAKVAGGMLTVTPALGEPLRPVRVRLKDGQVITR